MDRSAMTVTKPLKVPTPVDQRCKRRPQMELFPTMARLLLTNVKPRAAFSSPQKIREQVMIKKLMGCSGWLKLSEDRTSFIFDPEKAEIVRKIFEASISGLGGYTIAKQLNAKKVPAFGPSPNLDQSTIHNMLRNRATIGEHRPKSAASSG